MKTEKHEADRVKQRNITNLFKSLHSMYKNFLQELSRTVGKSIYIFDSRATLEVAVYIIGSTDEKLKNIIRGSPCITTKVDYNRDILKQYINLFKENMELVKKILCLGSTGLIETLMKHINQEKMTFHLLVIIHILFNTAMQKIVDYTSDRILDNFIGKVIENIGKETWEILTKIDERKEIEELARKGKTEKLFQALTNIINREYGYEVTAHEIREDMRPKCIYFQIECPYAKTVHITDRENWGICTYAILLSTLLKHLNQKIVYIGSKMKKTGSKNLIATEN